MTAEEYLKQWTDVDFTKDRFARQSHQFTAEDMIDFAEQFGKQQFEKGIKIKSDSDIMSAYKRGHEEGFYDGAKAQLKSDRKDWKSFALSGKSGGTLITQKEQHNE